MKLGVAENGSGICTDGSADSAVVVHEASLVAVRLDVVENGSGICTDGNAGGAVVVDQVYGISTDGSCVVVDLMLLVAVRSGVVTTVLVLCPGRRLPVEVVFAVPGL